MKLLCDAKYCDAIDKLPQKQLVVAVFGRKNTHDIVEIN